MDVYVISRAIGTVHIDQTSRESHESTMRVSDNPVESGAVIADHAALEPRRLTISGQMVDWLPAGVNYEAAQMIAPRTSIDFLNYISLPAPVQTFTNETRLQAARVSGMAAPYASYFPALSLARPLAPWLPDFAPASTLDLSAGTLRVEQCFDNLRMVQRSGDPVVIVTGSQQYENMLLIAVSMDQHFDGSATLEIAARELFIVETQTVSGITVAGAPGGGTKPAGASKNMSGRASAQAAAVANKGNIKTPEVTPGRQSALDFMLHPGRAWRATEQTNG
ncbi:phage baseplate protein [Paraburkholderia sp. BR10923]|uniref:phage baseplate protein n=1 Tax=Paraburkholderia sp. BR10923 TaxID=3236992 RepID=UPI0034CE69D4